MLDVGGTGGRYQVNVSCRKLKALMAEREVTIKELANETGISSHALSRKINGKKDWVCHEVILITNFFNCKNVEDIFLESFTAKTKQAKSCPTKCPTDY